MTACINFLTQRYFFRYCAQEPILWTFHHVRTPFSLSTENLGSIWGVAQYTNNKKLITACVPLLTSYMPWTVEIKLTLDQMKDLLQWHAIRQKGGELQLRFVANWFDDAHSSNTNKDPVGQFDSLLPLMDLKTMSEDALHEVMGENCIIMQNHECRYFLMFIIPNLSRPLYIFVICLTG